MGTPAWAGNTGIATPAESKPWFPVFQLQRPRRENSTGLTRTVGQLDTMREPRSVHVWRLSEGSSEGFGRRQQPGFLTRREDARPPSLGEEVRRE